MSEIPNRPASGRSATFLLLVSVLGVILLTEWHHQVVLDGQFGEREALIHQRQEILNLERDLLLARSDEVEILSAGRWSLVEALLGRLGEAENQLEDVGAALQELGEDPEPLGLALAKYRHSVKAELDLLARIGLLGEGEQWAELRELEQRLLRLASASRRQEERGDLLELQLLEREFASTLMTSKALALLSKVDALRQTPELAPSLRELLGSYRGEVEAAMSDALELELLRGESSLRFSRLPPMFRRLEKSLDHRLEEHLSDIARHRRSTGWRTAALLVIALLALAFRVRQQRTENLRLQARIASLADGMQAFAAGEAQERLKLPRSGRLGSVTESFLSMASRIRQQIETIRSERNRAEEALRVKSDFLARVSHELRTPLHGILGMAELLSQSSRDERHKHLVRSISRSGSTLLSVVNDLLDYSKLEAGKLALAEQSFDLFELCETHLAVHATVAHSKGLEIFLNAECHHAPVIGDPLRLGQVLTNLLGNAVKFTDRGFVELTLDLRESAGQLACQLRVRDTGPGIPSDARAEIFESFAQAAPVMRRREGGTGLGLSIVKELLDLMGGEIRVEDAAPIDAAPIDAATADSRGGPGVAFIVSLNLRKGAIKEESWRRLKDRRLLLIDRHREYSAALANRLRSAGAMVECRAPEAPSSVDDFTDVDVALLGVPASGGQAQDPAQSQDSRPAEGGEFQGNGDLSDWEQRLRDLGIPVLLLVPSGDWRESAEDTLELPRTCRLSAIEGAVAASLGLATAADTASSSEAVEALPQTLEGRILLVEDNPISRDLVHLMLEDSGCEVVAEENGRRAVERVQKESFDLILMDCHMPEMDGFEATRAIRELGEERLSKVPILALTASVLESDRRRCHEAGMDEVLSKPVSQRDLMQTLGRWLGGSETERR